ncbi:MAG TPA: RHS repeat-associated core domain-containing protein, partial [Saprospiraceae bacterium]|nr:RHS repeat-associated core domain-containing protein [Saprospiraceae bacterium]
ISGTIGGNVKLSFDGFGNVLQSTVNVNNIETTITTTTFGKYGTPVPAHPTSVTVNRTRSGQAAYSKTINYTYNSIGQMTSKVDFAGTAKPITTTLSYNTLGNLIKSRISAPDIVARDQFNHTYDSKGRWPLSSTSPEGNSSMTYHSFWGKPLSVIGIDGLTTTFSYDLFGRDSTLTMPQGFTITTKYVYNSTWGALYRKEVIHPGKPNQIVYYDKLNRPIKTETEGWQNNWVYTGITYNALGLKVTETGPHKLNLSEVGDITYYAYDKFKRPIWQRRSYGSNNDTTLISYTYSSGNAKVTITNPAGQVSSSTTDATSKLISSTDYGGTIDNTYFSHGNVYQSKNGSTVLTTNNYDIYARQSQLIDINGGTTSYTYNSIGEVTQQINANSQTMTYAYDTLGRVTSKIIPEGTSQYEYFPKNNGANSNKLKKITYFTTPNLEEYTYDVYGRVQTKKYTIDAVAHTSTYTYNIYDDVLSELFESGFQTNYVYDSNGFLDKIKNTNNTINLFSNGTMNGYNQYLTYTLGNGISSTNTYYYGVPTRYYTASRQDYNMVWNYKTNNLTSRNDALISKTETFSYDNLNRLTGAVVSSGQTHAYTYASNGNISTKTDAGTYIYNTTKINQVRQINPNAGNISSTSQAMASYTSFLQPSTITEGVYNIAYTYADDENRIKSIMKVNTTTINTRYYFGNYEKDITGPSTNYIHYISDGERVVAVVVRNNGVDTYYYTYTDHLGSINVATNNTGTVVTNLNYDAWGRRRNAANWSYTGISGPPSWLTRGYTGHEHLEYFALINMNGRLYDPVLGRMLSVDNFVQEPSNTQSFNRYSYVMNNPLRYVDPSGEFIVADSWLIGFIDGFFSRGSDRFQNGISRANEMAVNDAKIWGGLFTSDSEKNGFGQTWEIVSRFTWQLPQTIAGIVSSHVTNNFGHVSEVEYYGGATVTKGRRNGWGAVTLGNYIIGDVDIADGELENNELFKHEYGHYLQSQSSGYLYLFKYGLPSITSPDPHRFFWTETDANRRAFNYFSTERRLTSWNERQYPLIDIEPNNPRWWEYPLGTMWPILISILNDRRPR